MFKAGQYVQVVKDLEGETPDGTMLPGHGSWIGSVGKFVAYRDGTAIVAFEESQMPLDVKGDDPIIGEYDAWFAETELRLCRAPRKSLHEYLLKRANTFRKHHMFVKVTHDPIGSGVGTTKDCKVLYMHATVEDQDPFMIVRFPDGSVHQVKSYNCYPQTPGWVMRINYFVQWHGWEAGHSNRWEDLRNAVCLLLSIAFQFYPTGYDPY